MEFHRKCRHSNEKPHKCEKCGDTFSVIQLLKHHTKNVHDKTRPYECKICQMTFNTKDGPKGLDHHFARYHELRNVENCPYCEKQYSRLAVHVLNCRSNPSAKRKKYKCSNCDKSYSDKGGLNIHLKKNKCKPSSNIDSDSEWLTDREDKLFLTVWKIRFKTLFSIVMLWAKK